MKLLIATGLYPPDIGGPATYTVFLEKYAEKLGLSLVVVAFNRVRRYPPIIRHIVYFFMLVIQSRRCKALYALDTISVGVPALIASMLTRKKLILRVPGDYAWEQGQQRYGVTETLEEFRTHQNHPIRVRFLSWLQRCVAQHAMYVVVPSDYMKEVVSDWGVSPERITRMYSVLKEMHTQSVTEEQARSSQNDFVVTTAARLVPWKGIDTLIDVIASLRQDGVSARLLVIGDGVCRSELEARSAKSGASEHIQFLGAISRDALAGEIMKSHVFVLNTSYEGLSHQLIEVMSLGVPIITTPVGGNVELITHEETGLLVPYNDSMKLKEAIVRLRDDKTLARSLSERAKQSVNRFREDRIVKELQAFIKKI